MYTCAVCTSLLEKKALSSLENEIDADQRDQCNVRVIFDLAGRIVKGPDRGIGHHKCYQEEQEKNDMSSIH